MVIPNEPQKVTIRYKKNSSWQKKITISRNFEIAITYFFKKTKTRRLPSRLVTSTLLHVLMSPFVTKTTIRETAAWFFVTIRDIVFAP